MSELDGNELSYSSDFAKEDAYLGEGGVNFSRESSDEDLNNMFADLAAAQTSDPEGGSKKKKAKKSKATKKKGGDKSKADKSKADKPKADKPKADKPKADKPKADKPKADKSKVDKVKNDSEFIHYTMVTDSGKEVGDYSVRRGKQGPVAAAKKAATRYINDHKLKDKSAGKFSVKIRQTTRGQGYNKMFTYNVEFKKVKASAFIKEKTGRDYTLAKKLIAA
jgi:hypothetical protein